MVGDLTMSPPNRNDHWVESNEDRASVGGLCPLGYLLKGRRQTDRQKTCLHPMQMNSHSPAMENWWSITPLQFWTLPTQNPATQMRPRLPPFCLLFALLQVTTPAYSKSCPLSSHLSGCTVIWRCYINWDSKPPFWELPIFCASPTGKWNVWVSKFLFAFPL